MVKVIEKENSKNILSQTQKFKKAVYLSDILKDILKISELKVNVRKKKEVKKADTDQKILED